MAKGYIPLPDGSYLTVRDDETPEQAIARARKEFPEAFQAKAPAPEQEEGILAAGIGGAKRMVSTIGTGLEALISPEEAARKGVERGEAISQQYAPGANLEAVRKAYEERGLLPAAGEVVSQIPTALAEQFPQIAATLGGAKAGALAGQRIAGPRGALIGGIGGAAAPSLAQLFGANIERQASEQMEEGKPLDISRTKAAAAAVPGAALEVASTFIPLGRNIVGKLLGPGAQQALARGATQATENLAKEGLTKVLAKGTAVGALAEIPTEVIQQMLERAQAGLPLTTEDALAEYGEAAYGATLVGGPFGAVGRVGQRSVARGEVAETEAKARAEEQRLAAEEKKKQEEAAAAEEEAKLKSPQYRLDLNNQLVEAKDRLRDIETVLKDKTLDEDVKKEAIEEAKTLRKTISDLNAKMKASLAKTGEAPTLQKALAKQKEAPEARTIVDEFGNVVTADTGVQEPKFDAQGRPIIERTKEGMQVATTKRQLPKALTPEEEAAGQELQSKRVNEQFAKYERDYQALQEKRQKEELKKDAKLQQQLSGFIEQYEEFQNQPYGPTEYIKSEREKQQAQEITFDRIQLSLKNFVPRLLGLQTDETVANLQNIYDRMSDPEAIAKTRKGATRTEAARKQYMAELGSLENKLRTAYDKAAPNSREGYNNAISNGIVNRFVTSALGIKGLGGRTVPFSEALPQVQERIAELEERRRQAVKENLMSDKGELTPAGIELVVNEAKLNELKSIVEGARGQAPVETGVESAIEGTVSAAAAGQARYSPIEVEQGLAKAAYDAKIKAANKKATGSFDDLLSFVDDLQKKRFFGGAPGQLGLASSTEEGLQEQIKEAKGRLIDGLLEEIATTRVANKMKSLSTSEAYLFVEDIGGLLDTLIERSLAAAPGMQTETITTPGQMRGTKLVEGATETEIDTRTQRQLPFGATPRSKDIIAGMSEKDQKEFAEKFTGLRKRVKDATDKVEQIDARLNAMEPPKPVAKKGEPAPEPTQRRATLPESPEAQELAAERVKALDELRKAQEDLAAELTTINNAVRGVSEKQAVQTIRNVIRSIKESTIDEGKISPQLNRPLLRQQFASAPKEETLAQKADRVVEEVNDILRMEGVEQDVLDTFQEAADFIALRTDVSGEKNDFIDLVDEQVQRIKQGTDDVDAPELIGDIRGFLGEQRRGREFAEADDTMMVTKGKRFEEVETQPDLFPETKATTRATPGMFRRLLKSKNVAELKQALKDERDLLEKAEKNAKIQDDIRRRKPTNDLVQLAENIEEQLKVIKDVLLGTKTEPGVLAEKRQELQDAQKLVQAEIERLAASVQADKKKIESTKVKLATAKRGTSLSPKLAKERKPLIKELEADIKALTDGIAKQEAQIEDLAGILDGANETYAQQLAFFDKRVASEVEFYKKLLKKAQELGGVRLKIGVESAYSVKPLPFVATTTVPRKVPLPIKRQLNSEQLKRVKELLFDEQRILEAIRKDSAQGLAVGKLQEDLQKTRDALRGVVDVDNVRQKVDLKSGTYTVGYSYEQLNTAATKIQRAAAKARGLLLKAGDEAKAETEKQNRANEAFQMRLVNKLGLPGVKAKALVTQVKKGKGKTATTDVVRRLKITQEETRTPEQIAEELEKLKVAEKAGEVGKKTAKAIRTAKVASLTRAVELQAEQEATAKQKQSDLIEELKARAKAKQDPVQKLIKAAYDLTPQQREGYAKTYNTLANEAKKAQQQVDAYIKKHKNAEKDAKLGELRAEADEAATELRNFERNLRFNLKLPDLLEDEAAVPRQQRPKLKTKAGPVMGFDKKFTPDQMRAQTGVPSKQTITIKTNTPPEFAIGDNDPTGEIDVAEAKKFLADVKAKAAKQGIKVKIYPIAEVLSPELYGETLAALGPTAARRVKGGVEPNGDVFFVIESHSTLQDLKETVAHELIGHYTFEGMLGEKGLKRLLKRLEKTHGNISKLAEKIGGEPLLRKVAQAEAMMKKIGATDDEVRMRGLNELVAYTMEKRVDQDFLTRAKQWLQELVGAIRMGLRELGLDMGGMSTSELFYLMRQADRNFKSGKPIARIESDGTVKYSVGAAPAEETGFRSIIASRGDFYDNAKGFATGMTGLAGRVKFLDRFAAIEAVMKKALSAGQIDALRAFHAMYYSRLSDQRNNFVAQSATSGPPKLVTTANGERIYETGDAPSLKEIAEILTESGIPPADVEIEFTAYIAALRAKQIPGGIEKLSTEEKITPAQVEQKIAQYANNAAFQKAREKYKQYNNALIDFVIETGAMTKEKAATLKNIDYIPFYRAEGDDVFLDLMGEKPIRIGDLKNQPYLKELIGGRKRILPVFTSSLTNTQVLLDMGLKNMATANVVDALRQLGIAKVNKGKGPANNNVLRFKAGGEDYHAVIDTKLQADLFGDIPTELIVEGMEGLKGVLPVGVRLMGAPANWLRKWVTRDPRYAFRQIFRDSMAAAMTTGADFVPVVQTLKDMATMNKTGVLGTLQKRGITGGQVITGSTDDMGKILQQIGSGKTGWTSAMAKLDELAMMGDAATRVSMYNSFLKQGLSEGQATLATLEAMNFSRRGTSISVLYANTLIPFFNASLQGLDVLYRAFKGDMVESERLRVKQKLYARLGIMAGMTLAYAAMMQDDETYENANAEERYANWFVPTPFGTVRVPIPFELGLIGKALPEGVYRLAASDDSLGEVSEAIYKLAQRSVPIDVPTAAKPAIEWALNRSFFTGRDLVTASMPDDPRFQYNLNTPEIVKLFGNIGISPAKLENLIRGYTGGLGVNMLRLLDPVFGGELVKPGQGLANAPIIGGIFQPEDASGIINAAYNTANELEAISKTYKRLELEDPDEAEKYLDKKLIEIDSASDAGRFKQYMGALTKEEREIRADKTLSPAEKSQYLKDLRQEKIEASKEFRQMILETKRQAA